MSGIVELLKAFDRKERAWLVRMALKPAALDRGFLDRVTEVLPSKPPLSSDAWWGMDYHIDWLVAALHAFKNGWSVDELTTQDPVAKLPKDMITHSIEDFDFIIANDHRIILIEAKAFGDWGKKQFKSKMDRLNRLKMISQKGVVTRHATAKCALPKVVQLHLIVTSITDSLSEELKQCVPAWALIEDSEDLEKHSKGRSPAWIELDTNFNKPPNNRPPKKIVRCDLITRKPNDKGEYWKIDDEKKGRKNPAKL